MSEIYKVTFNIEQVYGYIALDESKKELSVVYPDEKIVEKIKTWLQTKHEINTPNAGGSVSDFSVKTYLATNSVEDFETVLTRAWQKIGIHIDWSFPAGEI